MKTPQLKLCKALALVLAILVSISYSNDVYGQSMDKQSAIKEGRANRSLAGFSKINFRKADLLTVLEGAAALKISNGLANGSRSTVLMIIGLDSNGNEIGDTYLQSNSSGAVFTLKKGVQDLQMSNAATNRRITGFSISFGKQSLMDMLNAPGVTGIDFLPTMKDDGSGSKSLTLIASPSGSTPEVQQMSAMMSPCPPECFGLN